MAGVGGLGHDPRGRVRRATLLAVAAAVGGERTAALELAAALVALDSPREALSVVGRQAESDPWATWWGVVAAGQLGDSSLLQGALAQARQRTLEGDGAREVGRRLDDLAQELAALFHPRGDEDARFAVLGHRSQPQRRMLIGGRSSATFLVDPGWESLRLVRLGPTDGPSVGNRAHLSSAEIQAAVRRGEAGPGWEVPPDSPLALEPQALLAALREDVAARDRRLLELAQEVAAEREELRAERRAVAEAREALDIEAQRARYRAAQAARAAGVPSGTMAAAVAAPTTAAEARALLGVDLGASTAAIEAAWREQVVLCHPDRVAKLHPAIRTQAEGLTVALNAARDLLTTATRRR